MSGAPAALVSLAGTAGATPAMKAEPFDLVEGTKLAGQRLENNAPGRFFDATYAIPPELALVKETITVRFQAHPGKTAGGVFEVRVLRAKQGAGGPALGS